MVMYTRPITSYWQDKGTGQVIECCQPPSHTPSREWNVYFREVRLLHNAALGQVQIEDAGTCLSATDDPDWVRVDLQTFKYWDLIYSNPDI